MHRYHTQLLTVTSDIDMISVVFIRDKLIKLHASDSKPVLCLPCSLVPSLDITSWSYQKAVMMLGKQQAIPDPVTKWVPLILVLDWGSTPLFLLLFLTSSVKLLTDIIIGTAQKHDAEFINKACNIIHNAIIQDLEQADTSCSRIYENIICQHIISHMQHLHVNLFTVKIVAKMAWSAPLITISTL